MNFLETVADHYFRLRQNVKTDVKSQIVHQVNTFILEHISEFKSACRRMDAHTRKTEAFVNRTLLQYLFLISFSSANCKKGL